MNPVTVADLMAIALIKAGVEADALIEAVGATLGTDGVAFRKAVAALVVLKQPAK